MDQKIVDKIAALLAKTKANGCTEAEAGASMYLATKLMKSYGVTLEDIKKKDKSAFDLGAKPVPRTRSSLSIIDKILLHYIANFTQTNVFVENRNSSQTKGTGARRSQSRTIVFIGYRIDVELAIFVYKTCESAVDTEWALFAGRFVPGLDVRRYRA